MTPVRHSLQGARYRPTLGIWTATCTCTDAFNGPTRADAEQRVRAHASIRNRAAARLAAEAAFNRPSQRPGGTSEILG